MITVYAPGALTTVQDLGRHGHAASGVPPSGAMDAWALRAANLLAGNDERAAGLEMTMTGPTLGFDRDTVVALTGSKFDARILVSLPGSEFERDVEPKDAPHGESFLVRAGESLRVGRMLGGARAYLAIRGGITVEPVLGSRATHATAGLGGATLRAGDTLPVGEAADGPLRRLDGDDARPDLVRAIGEGGLFGHAWTVSTAADRVGVRLTGDPLVHDGPAEIDPRPMPRGAVQLPGDGLPIVLGPDGPVTGGYPMVACVIAADLWVLAHAKPGDTLRFEESTVEEARAAWRAREEGLRRSVVDV